LDKPVGSAGFSYYKKIAFSGLLVLKTCHGFYPNKPNRFGCDGGNGVWNRRLIALFYYTRSRARLSAAVAAVLLHRIISFVYITYVPFASCGQALESRG
jgi:hypothetical protein